MDNLISNGKHTILKLDDLLQIVCDPENQPHQFIGDSKGLKRVFFIKPKGERFWDLSEVSHLENGYIEQIKQLEKALKEIESISISGEIYLSHDEYCAILDAINTKAKKALEK